MENPASPDPVTPPDPDLPVILAFGDSLTAGHGVDPRMAYPAQLQQRMNEEGYAVRVVNQGISGDTTSGGIARLDQALALEPLIVILELGANDALRGTPMVTVRENLEVMVEAFQANGAEVVLAGLTLPRNYGPAYIRNFENVFSEIAAEHDAVLIPFFLEGLVDLGALDRGEAVASDFSRYMQSDGTHPTGEGYALVTETVLRTIEPLVEEALAADAGR